MLNAAATVDAVRPNIIGGGYARDVAGRVLRGRGSAVGRKNFGAAGALGAPIGSIEANLGKIQLLGWIDGKPPFSAGRSGVVAWPVVAWNGQGLGNQPFFEGCRLIANLTTRACLGRHGGVVDRGGRRGRGALPPCPAPSLRTTPRRARRSWRLRHAAVPILDLRTLVADAVRADGRKLSRTQMGSGVRERGEAASIRERNAANFRREAMGQGAMDGSLARDGTGAVTLWRGGVDVNASL